MANSLGDHDPMRLISRQLRLHDAGAREDVALHEAVGTAIDAYNRQMLDSIDGFIEAYLAAARQDHNVHGPLLACARGIPLIGQKGGETFASVRRERNPARAGA
jgi:hypothetical protein